MIKPTFLFVCSYSIAFCAVSFLSLSCNQAAETAETTAAEDSNGYELIWSDEFNGIAVDTGNWVYDIGGEGWGNHEQEYYQPANATVEEGNLVITGKKETVGKNPFTSTRMKTKGKREFLYGKIEARIKMPVGEGLWPAFWMLGANIDSVDWPACGEIDIMEHINSDSLIFGTPHWNNDGHKMQGDTIASTPSAYHVYAIEWDSDAIRWYLDGKQFRVLDISNSINSTEEFHRPHFMLLNLAIGGDWPGQTIDESKIPAKMYVDYVRVYKRG
jgi:beta-glucanase (GH16 family)